MIDYEVEVQKDVPVPKQRGFWNDLVNKMELNDSVILKTRSHAMTLTTILYRNGFRGLVRKSGEYYRIWKLQKKEKK